MRRACFALFLFGTALSFARLEARSTAAEGAGAGFRIIVHPSNPASELERRFVGDVFLKRVSRWPDGELVRPVDLPAESGVRQRFVEAILKRSLAAVKNYWQQAIFSGANVPPPELESEDAVVRYVLGHRGGIGYVSENGNVGAAKVVPVR